MKKTLLFATSILLCSISYAQQAIVGNISDDSNNSPLEGVIIKVKDTKVVARSNANGNYSIDVPTGKKTLIFKKEGYSVKEIKIASNIINVKMTGTLEELFNLTIDELLNLRITTSSKKEEPLQETPAYAIVLTSDEINTLNFNSLKEVIDYIVGLSTVSINGNVFTSTTSRGNSVASLEVNNLLLFDGIPLYNMFHGGYDYSFIPLSSIKQIEIVKGSNSVLYGTNAMTTVINIIPKENTDNEHKFSGRIKYGSFNTSHGQAAITGKKDDLKFGIFTDFTASEGEKMKYFQLANGNQSDFRRTEETGALAGYVQYRDFKFNIQTVNRKYRHFINNFDTLSVSKGEDIFSLAQPQRTNIFQNMFSLRYDKQINNSFGVKLRSSFQNYYQLRTFSVNKRKYFSEGFFNEVDIIWTPNDKLGIIFGTHYNHYNAHRYTRSTKNNIRQNVEDVNPSRTPTNDLAFYVNGDFQIFDKLKLFYGARYYILKYDGSEQNNFSPRFAISYHFNKNYNIKAIYGHSFRVPTYLEKSIKAVIIGNPDLSPETSVSYDLIFSGSSNRIQFNIDLYYNTIKEKIIREPVTEEEKAIYGAQAKSIYRNTSETDYYGAELSGKFVISDILSGFFGYAYAHAENPNDNPNTNSDDPWYFEHLFNGGISFRPIPYLEANLSAKLISDWGLAPSNSVINVGVNIYPKKNYPFCIELKADNIFDETVGMPDLSNRRIEVPYTPKTMSRSFHAGLCYKF